MLDWVLGPFLSLLIGTLLGGEITRYFYKPKVIIKYKDVAPLVLETGTFWSLRVENRGRTVATDCIGVLTLEDVTPEDIINQNEADTKELLPEYRGEAIDMSFPREQIISRNYFREINRTSLCWAKLGNPDKIDVNPGVSQSIDICKHHRLGEFDYFIFPSEEGWRRLRVRVKSKNLKGSLYICPSNEFPTQIDFTITIEDTGASKFTPLKPKRWRFSR